MPLKFHKIFDYKITQINELKKQMNVILIIIIVRLST